MSTDRPHMKARVSVGTIFLEAAPHFPRPYREFIQTRTLSNLLFAFRFLCMLPSADEDASKLLHKMIATNEWVAQYVTVNIRFFSFFLVLCIIVCVRESERE